MPTSLKPRLGLTAFTLLSLSFVIVPAVALYYHWRQSPPGVVPSPTQLQEQPQRTKTRPSVVTMAPPARLATSQPVAVSPVSSAQTQPSMVAARVLSATLGTIKLKPITLANQPNGIFDFGQDQGLVSNDVLLWLELEIANTGSRLVTYQPWSGGGGLLTDDRGRTYAAGAFADAVPEGSCRKAVILPPGGMIKDLLVFQRPQIGAKQWRLVLSGKNVGQDQLVLITIPASDIRVRPASEDNLGDRRRRQYPGQPDH